MKLKVAKQKQNKKPKFNKSSNIMEIRLIKAVKIFRGKAIKKVKVNNRRLEEKGIGKILSKIRIKKIKRFKKRTGVSFLVDYFFRQKIVIAKWELNLFGLILFIVGLSSGLFFALYNLGVLFAAPTQSSKIITTQTEFNYGTFSSTQSTNTAGGEVELAGGSGPDGTLYFKDIVINSTNTNIQTEYQVLVDGLDTAAMVTAGKLQADCDDLRFTNSGGTSIPYSIVANSCNTADTEIWVIVDSIAASVNTTIKMYYGAPSAIKGSSETATFSYTTEKVVGYTLTEGTSSMQVMTLEAGNTVTHNGVTRTLTNEMDTSSFTSINQYGSVSAKKLFEMKNTTASDMIMPVSWAGTEFILSNRNSAYDLNLTLVSPWGTASVDVYVNGTKCGATLSVTSSGKFVSGCGDSGYSRVRVVSTNSIPILVNKTDSGGNDPMPIHPADVGPWYGFESTQLLVKSGPSGADYRWIDSGAGSETNPGNLGANAYVDVSTGGGSYYSGDTVRVRSVDNPIGVQSYADADGGDATTHILRTDFGTKFGSPFSTDFVAIVSDQATICRTYNSAGSLYQTLTLTSANSSVYEVGGTNFGVGNSSTYMSGKWKLQCDDPVMVVTQYVDDEQNMFSYPMMRQFTYPTPTVGTPGTEQPALPSSGTWTSSDGAVNSMDIVWNGGWSDNGNGNSFEANGNFPVNTDADFEMRISTDGSAWTNWYNMTDEDADVNIYGVSAATLETQFPQVTYNAYRYLQFRATLSQTDQVSNPSLEDVSVYYLKDVDPPSANPTTVECWNSVGKTTQYTSGNWYSDTDIYCEWSGATDLHSGVAGYYIHNDINNSADPVTQGSQQTATNATFTNFTSHDTNYILIKTYDLVGNITASSVEGFQYLYDTTDPVNPTSLVPTPAGFSSNQNNFSFTWNNGTDTSGSGIKEYCYKTGAVGFTETCIPGNTVNGISAYQDGSNVFYIRSKDNVDNIPPFYTQVNYYYSGNYPTPPQGLSAVPNTNTSNSFSFSWYEPVTYTGTIQKYYYSINALPSADNTTTTTTSETSNRSVGPGAFATQQGSNLFYVVAEDDIGVNWDAYSQVEFTASTTAPGIPTSVTVTDSSIRVESKYLLTITWNQPVDVGSGIDHYVVERSTSIGCATDPDPDSIFSEYAQTINEGYLDSGLSNTITYCYRVRASDNAGADSIASSIISALPEGRYTAPPTIIVSPEVSPLIQSAIVTWKTDREGSSFVEFGTTNALGRVLGQDDFVTNHSVTLLDLEPSTAYYYKVKFTDQDGNVGYSSVSTFATADAPSAPTSLSVTPASSTTNSFAFSWSPPADEGVEIQGYYYSVNSTPTSINTTYTTAMSLASAAFATQQGTNTFYVVAMDSDNNVNYSNYASIEFQASTPAPAIPTGIIITDASNRETEDYTIALKWSKVVLASGGDVTYTVYRSIDGTSFESIAQLQTTGYLDVELDNTIEYFYYVTSSDDAGSISAASTTASEIPEGRYTSPPEITKGPSAVADSFSSVVIWDTDRTADSHVEFGVTEELEEEQGTIEETDDHIVNLEGLRASTTYYYRIRSRDQDGNVALSVINTFTTLEAPRVSEVVVSDIKLYEGLVTWITNKDTTSKIEYGSSISYGSVVYDISNSLTKSHTLKLTGLVDGTTYHFRPTGEDANGNPPESGDYSFQTLTFPEVLTVNYENKSEGQTEITWTTNVATTSIVEYYNDQIAPKTQGNQAYTKEHSVLLFGLEDATVYQYKVRGTDQFGYNAESEEREFTTLEDTTPPEIFSTQSESNTIGSGETSKVQIVVSWKTDEPTTSQVEYGVGLGGSDYTDQTDENAELVMDHLTVISDLAPAKTYHFRVVSADKANNQTKSGSHTVLTSRKKESFLQLIISNLEETFSWIGNMGNLVN